MKTSIIKAMTRRACLELAVIVVFALAVTLPFAGQPFSFDGPLVVEFAKSQVEDPLRQHIDDFDYFGIHYDRFTNTHPRFLSLFLSIVIRLFGASEVPVHLALAVFPAIGGAGMYFLGRRFGVSGIGAALFFLASPVVLVSSHTEMVDMPGTCLWLASLTAFIYGVDRKHRLLLALAGILFLLTMFTFYQGLTVLGLALVYLVLKKRFALRNFLPIAAAAALFLVYLFWFHRYYGELPRFSYRIALPYYDKTVWNQLRGLLVITGGALMFPLVTVAAYARNWRVALVGAAAAACSWAWLAVRYSLGEFTFYEATALGGFLAAGILVVYAISEQLLSGIAAWLRKQNNDVLFPVSWFFAVFLYCAIFLGYPATRYFLPAYPAVVLIMLLIWRRSFRLQSFRLQRYIRPLLAGAGLGMTLAYAMVVSISYMDYAKESRETADWALEEYGEHDGRVWFSGELGFSYYMRQNGFTMVPSVTWHRYSQTELNEPAKLPEPGDIIIASGLAGNWLPYEDVLPYMRLVEIRKSWSEYPLVTWSYNDRSRWSTTLLLPFVLSRRPVYTDEITVYRIVADPAPLLPEVEREVKRQR